MLARLRTWLPFDRLPPVALDAAAVVVLLLFGGVERLIAGPSRSPGVAALLGAVLLLQTLPLLFRRRWPVAVSVCVLGAYSADALLGNERDPAAGGILLAMFSVGAHAERVRRLVVGAAAAVALVVPVAAYLLAHTWSSAIGPGAGLVAAWLSGDYVRRRRAYLAEREGRATRDREEDRRRAASEERARIARELHDVVAHHVSVIVVQAGGARIVQGADPSAATRTLAIVEATARQVLTELSLLLGAIRSDGSPTSLLAPQPSLENLDALVQQARDAGLQVDLVVEGRRRTVPVALDLSAYRIVQEAITNAMKHAPSAHVEVSVSYGRCLELRVTDDGRGRARNAPADRSGHGLVGMRERVALFGGELQVGPTSQGGFRVVARLPLEDGAS
jgi:signal transduction histidine kinase